MAQKALSLWLGAYGSVAVIWPCKLAFLPGASGWVVAPPAKLLLACARRPFLHAVQRQRRPLAGARSHSTEGHRFDPGAGMFSRRLSARMFGGGHGTRRQALYSTHDRASGTLWPRRADHMCAAATRPGSRGECSRPPRRKSRAGFDCLGAALALNNRFVCAASKEMASASILLIDAK